MIIYGDKVYLRAIENKDSGLLFDLINDPETEMMVCGNSWPVSIDEQRLWMERQTGRKDLLRCIIADKESNNAIGTIILSDLDYKNGVAQVHIKISKEQRGRGYGVDALKTIVVYAFSELRLHCLYAEILTYNLASVRIFEKCGFRKEGILRHRVYKKGQYYDTYIYSVLSGECS